MTARMKRLASDYKQVMKDFAGHKNIIVTPVGGDPPEKYKVTYFVNGIYLLPDGRIETLGRHEVEITLHADYPRYKPICKILTPIWHPNFRDGQICIGDIWGAGESLSDIIINIGDMIQYKSWNSYSPLSAEAAKWAMENKHLFPVGNIDLHISDYASAKDTVEIDLFDDSGNMLGENTTDTETSETSISESAENKENPGDAGNAEEKNNDDVQKNENTSVPVNNIPPKAENISPNAENTPPKAEDTPPKTENIPPKTENTQPKAENNVKEPVMPSVPVIPKTTEGNDFNITAEELSGIEFVPTAQRMQTVSQGGMVQGGKINFRTIFTKGILWALIGGIIGFIIQELLDAPTSSDAVLRWMGYADINDLLYYVDYDRALNIISNASRISSAIFSAIIACALGLFMGIGEGVFYGSKENTIKYAGIGAGLSIVIGFVSGYIAQWLYASLLGDDASDFYSAFIRGLGWAIMGLGVGIAVGLIKPEQKRILYCGIGGLGGGFIGGFIFNFITDVFSMGENDTGTVARAVGIVIMGVLIGLGIGLLEQFAKQAWLKVIRGEFEGKEYLVFSGTTSIGNNSKNTIVLFKDKLVGPHHCDIVLEGSKYVLVDCGTPMGTVVNGMRISRHVLRQGDAIAIGNSVLVFNTR